MPVNPKADGERAERIRGLVLESLQELKGHHENSYAHSLRVGNRCRQMAEKFYPDDQYEFTMAGMLHDLGKVKVPVEILDKESDLDPGEWELINEHARDAAERIHNEMEMPRAALIVLGHHSDPRKSVKPVGEDRRVDDLPEDIKEMWEVLEIIDVADALFDDNRYYKKDDVWTLKDVEVELTKRFPHRVDEIKYLMDIYKK